MEVEKKYGNSGNNNSCTEDDVREDYDAKDCIYKYKSKIYKFEIKKYNFNFGAWFLCFGHEALVLSRTITSTLESTMRTHCHVNQLIKIKLINYSII